MVPDFDSDYRLEDRYALESGRAYLTGVQALVRIPLMQRQRDAAAGLNTAGFISGYRGSPLGSYDLALWQAKSFLDQHQVRFEPGVNEDLAATAVWGSQQANLHAGARYDGVFGIWYGKGPGVDRSCDALKHANYAGTSRYGGVLAFCGDDPGAKSSSIAHQSEYALVHLGMPILNPADVQEYLDFGLLGFGLSRYSGLWVGFKCLTDTVDSSRSVSIDPERVQIVAPSDHELPEGGLSIAWGNLPLAVEQRLYQQRLPAAQAFARANGLDRVVLDSPRRRLGIVTTGKTYHDVLQALDELGIDRERAAALGVSLYKVGMPWPLEAQGIQDFSSGLEQLLIVEEKRPLIEEQLARVLYNLAQRPTLSGKRDVDGALLVPSEGELTPALVIDVLGRWLSRYASEFSAPLKTAAVGPPPAGAPMRLPSFCSGCPHNTSTTLPDGSVAFGGIGCHGMAVWMPDRPTLAVTQMGGEGANWVGQAGFIDESHIFQNIGDGTYFHSGLLAIRAALNAGVNITYKILLNGAIAMTGGQPIEGEELAGELATPDVAHQIRAEGVQRIAVVSDRPAKYARGALPSGTTVHHRDQLDRVQRELRLEKGVSALIYDQTCAAEARRLRKRGELPDPDRRVVINELICEGCGDCSLQSNCISIEPVETEFGRKRTIHQSSCNKDFSCLKGYCPSFVTVSGGRLRKQALIATDTGEDSVFANLPDSSVASCSKPFNVLITGIGGTGVVTVGALLNMAAHLEGKGCSGLDVTGLAQKNGPVTSHVRIAQDPDDLHATRISSASADLLLGCDIVVAAGIEGLSKLSSERTVAVVNERVAPTSDFTSNPDMDLSATGMKDAIRLAVGHDAAHFVSASELATELLGDAIAGNLFLLGYALQLGRIPVGQPALERAIELNGRSVEINKRALMWGRLAAHDPAAAEEAAGPALRMSRSERPAYGLDEIVKRRRDFLVDYQGERLARRYARRVDALAARERELGGGSRVLAEAVARAYFKLLSYKDEYEVGRLHTDDAFRKQLEAEFEGDYQLTYHLSPQFLPKNAHTGRARKIAFGSWVSVMLGVFSRMRFLRGTPLDPLMLNEHRRSERKLIKDYERALDALLEGLSSENLKLAVEIAELPLQVRGFGDIKEAKIEEMRVRQSELLCVFGARTREA
ncbi:MAG: indolepyruvate ferredoxin oxidoreductase family protein [bacterium]|nr:indolepyruvate ferredoxin oxidoreductase family protein [bacterium]